jgi:hypothetical protein
MTHQPRPRRQSKPKQEQRELTADMLTNHPLPWARDPELVRDYRDMACRLFAAYVEAGDDKGAAMFADSAEQASELLAAWERVGA